MIKAVLFDFDGLMFDTERVFEKAFWIAGKKFDMPLTERDRQEHTGKTDKLVREELKAQFPNKDIDGYRDDFFRITYDIIDRKGVKMKKGLMPLIKYLKTNGYKTAVVSSSEKSRVLSIMKKRGGGLCEKCFDAFITATDKLPGKPNPDVFLAAAKRLDVAPNECVVLEDSINGIVAAHAAEMQPIMIPDRIPPNEKVGECGAVVLKNLNKVIGYLKTNN